MIVVPPTTLAKWTCIAKERLGDHRVFRVERLQMKDGRGDARRPFFVLDMPDWCNVVAVTKTNDLVLVRQYRFGIDALCLETPGGVIDAGESPAAAARRELREETGFAAETMTTLATVFANPALQNNRCHVFLAEGCAKVGEPHFDDDEECEVVTIPVAHAAALVDEGHVAHGICVLALERYLRQKAKGAP